MREFKSLRELAVQTLIDGTMVSGQRGARYVTRNQCLIGCVSTACGLIGLLHCRVREIGPLNDVVHQSLKLEDAGDARVAQRFVKRGDTQIGRQELDGGGEYRSELYAGSTAMLIRCGESEWKGR